MTVQICTEVGRSLHAIINHIIQFLNNLFQALMIKITLKQIYEPQSLYLTSGNSSVLSTFNSSHNSSTVTGTQVHIFRSGQTF